MITIQRVNDTKDKFGPFFTVEHAVKWANFTFSNLEWNNDNMWPMRATKDGWPFLVLVADNA